MVKWLRYKTYQVRGEKKTWFSITNVTNNKLQIWQKKGYDSHYPGIS
jgi:hypothetical protein